ncbi:MAG TPA: c-type cytochrome [Solirubrobacterales bacterium]|nr:c-type cytochrome [Solirubrobacterales bacterium]
MDNETLFYIFGGIAAVSAVLVTFAGLKLKNFPGRMLPLVIVWFAAFAIAAGTFSVLQAQDHEAHEAHKEQEAGHAEEAKSGPYENEGGALGGEQDELEEQAEEEAEGPGEDEPVGPTEGEGKEEASGGDAAAGASIFAENCAGCHGEDGHGGPGGPDLTSMPLAQTEEGTVEQVTNGGGGMPAFGEQLSEQEISDVAAFVVHDVVGK